MVAALYVIAYFIIGFVCAVAEALLVPRSVRAPVSLWLLWPMGLLFYFGFWLHDLDPVERCADAIRRFRKRPNEPH